MENLPGMLHLSRKAGKILFGQHAVLKRARGGKEVLMLISNDAGSALKRKLAEFRPVTVNWSSRRLAEILGRNKLAVVGITDPNMANNIRKLIQSAMEDKSNREG